MPYIVADWAEVDGEGLYRVDFVTAKVVAKFANYDDALEYAERLNKNATNSTTATSDRPLPRSDTEGGSYYGSGRDRKDNDHKASARCPKYGYYAYQCPPTGAEALCCSVCPHRKSGTQD